MPILDLYLEALVPALFREYSLLPRFACNIPFLTISLRLSVYVSNQL